MKRGRARSATGIQQRHFSNMGDPFKNGMQSYEKLNEKRVSQMEELEKIYDNCLWMQFVVLRDKLELLNLLKSAENLKEVQKKVLDTCTEEIQEMQRKLT